MAERRAARAFSLVEVAVALALLGVVLLTTLSLVWLELGVGRRLAAHREALAALEASHEALRAGAPPPAPCDSESGGTPFPAPGPRPAARDLVVCSQLEEELSGLYHLQLRARYRVGSRPFERVLESYLWRP